MGTYYFDLRGNLQPSEIIVFSWEELWHQFVDSYSESETRKKVFNNFVSFIQRFQSEIVSDFTIWINGSFVSQKLNPRDMDALFLIDYKICASKKSILDNGYFIKELKYTQSLDLYYSIEYPQNHKRHFLSHLNHLYWQDVYGHTRRDENAHQHTKGFIELKIDKSWKI